MRPTRTVIDALQSWLGSADGAQARAGMSAAERATLADVFRRDKALRAFVKRPGMRNGFLRIEKIARTAPTQLFGQNVPAMSHSRIVFCAGKPSADAATGWEPGEVIAGYDISDRELTALILESGRAEPVGMTARLVGDETLDDWVGPSDDLQGDMETRVDQALSTARDRADAAIKTIRKGKISTQQARDIRDAVTKLGKNGDVDFVLSTFGEALSKFRVEAEHEALSALAASHLPQGMLAIEHSRKGVFEDGGSPLPHAHPMADALRGDCRANEMPLLAGLLVGMAHSLAAAAGCDISAWSPQNTQNGGAGERIIKEALRRDLGYAFPGAEDGQMILSTVSMAQRLSNPHVREECASVTTGACGAVLGRVSGQMRIHSALVAEVSTFMSLEISIASRTTRYGSTHIRDVAPLISAAITYDDFMSALRTGQIGVWTPCTIDRIVGVETPDEEAPVTDLERASTLTDPAYIAACASVEAVAAQLATLLATGLARAEERQAAIALIEKAISLSDAVQTATKAAAQDASEEIVAAVHRKIDETMTALPAQAAGDRSVAIDRPKSGF